MHKSETGFADLAFVTDLLITEGGDMLKLKSTQKYFKNRHFMKQSRDILRLVLLVF